MLGMLIGVGSVIMLVAVGTGSSQKMQKQIEGLGTNLLQISKQGGFGGFGGRATTGTQSKAANLTAADVTALEDTTQNPDIVAVAPVTMANSVTAVYQGASYSPSSFVGTTPTLRADQGLPSPGRHVLHRRGRDPAQSGCGHRRDGCDEPVRNG